jgi:hypothetical protein
LWLTAKRPWWKLTLSQISEEQGGIMLLVPYAIRKNEWLGLIARRNKISLRELLKYNPQIHDPDHVWEGTIIKVPIDNSISPPDLSAAKDLPAPIVGPFVKAPDGVIIRLPDHIRLPYYGLAYISHERAGSASVRGTRATGYAVTLVLWDLEESHGAKAAKEVGEHAAVEGGVHLGVLPPVDLSAIRQT